MATVVTKPHKRTDKRNSTQTNVKGLQNKPEQVSVLSQGMVIGQKWRLGADSLNVILYKLEIVRKTNGKHWRAYGYYSSIKGALLALIDQGIRDTELKDLKEIYRKIDQLRKDITDAINKQRNNDHG